MITRQALSRARIVSVSMWGHWKTQRSAESRVHQIRQGCLDGYFGNISSAMTSGDESWAMFHLTPGCWKYREPYVQEIVDMFTPFFGDDGVYIHDAPQYGPRVVYRLRRGMAKETVHAFNVFLRYSWGHLHQWPIQKVGPDVRTVWQTHLDTLRWDTKSIDRHGYISHSNFCAPSSLSKFIGFTSQDYVSKMYEIMSEGMRGFPWSSMAKIPSSGSVTMKRYVFTMALTEYAETHHKEMGEAFDPFD